MENREKLIAARKTVSPAKCNLMRVSELARAASVSTPTVHYYLKEGLLTPPVIASRNMSYYDPSSVDEIRMIKDLQARRYLPLSAIKLLLKARRDGQEPDHILEMSALVGDIFRPVGDAGRPRDMSLTELAVESGLPVETLKTIQSWGLLSPVGKKGHERYDDINIRVAETVKELMDHGLTLSDLKVFGGYVEIMRAITDTVHARVHELYDKDSLRLVDLSRALENLRTLLTIGVHRQMFTGQHK